MAHRGKPWADTKFISAGTHILASDCPTKLSSLLSVHNSHWRTRCQQGFGKIYFLGFHPHAYCIEGAGMGLNDNRKSDKAA